MIENAVVILNEWSITVIKILKIYVVIKIQSTTAESKKTI